MLRFGSETYTWNYEAVKLVVVFLVTMAPRKLQNINEMAKGVSLMRENENYMDNTNCIENYCTLQHATFCFRVFCCDFNSKHICRFYENYSFPIPTINFERNFTRFDYES